MHEKAVIMDKAAMDRALVRIANEITELNNGAENVYLIGIQRRGMPLAKAIAATIQKLEGTKVQVGTLDITFYRDDLSMLAQHPIVNDTDIGFDVNNSVIILVDDVIYTGRTVRAAIDAVMDLGRPKCIELAVLIDRGHRELPIRPDFTGKNLPTSRNEIVEVKVADIDGVDRVIISES